MAKVTAETVPSIRDRMRQIAEKSGMTQEAIGLRMGFTKGGARQAVSRLLNPDIEYDPRLSTLLSFAKAVDTTLKEIL
jgi:transcriptional regulator with XRE-family HTH domain